MTQLEPFQQFLTLKELHQALQARNVEISYSALSLLLNTGDIASQLHVGGVGNRREFLPATVEVLAAFLPLFRQAEGVTKSAAPEFLRRFLQQEKSSSGAEIVSQISVQREPGGDSKTADPMEIAAAQGRAQGLASADEVMTAKEGAAFLRLSVRQFRRSFKVWKRFGESSRGDRYLKSQILS